MTEHNEHLSLWDQVKTTPTDAVKPADVDGQSITAIDTVYMDELATRMFGPQGIGWGYRIDEERFDQGAPIIVKDQPVANTITHTIRITLWYTWEGKVGEVTQFGHTKYVYMTNRGNWKTDGEAPKKSLTDAKKKCLSALGFSADVYAGMFDDQAYVKLREAETRLENADNFDAELEKYRNEYKAWIDRECETLRHKIPHPRSIEIAAESMLNRISDRAAVARVDPAKGISMIRRAAHDGIERATQARQPKAEDHQEDTSDE